MLRITKKMLANYLGVLPQNVKKHYQFYLDVLKLERPYLTIYDVAKVDHVKPCIVAELSGITNKEVLTLIKTNTL